MHLLLTLKSLGNFELFLFDILLILFLFVVKYLCEAHYSKIYLPKTLLSLFGVINNSPSSLSPTKNCTAI